MSPPRQPDANELRSRVQLPDGVEGRHARIGYAETHTPSTADQLCIKH